MELYTPCKRRIIVPDDLSFFQFHYVLQRCFEWKNCHLHQFVTEVDKAGYAAQVIHPDWNEMEGWENAQVLDSTKVTLREIFASRKQIIYEYDFGDGWMHTIELCRVIEDCPEPYPHCVMAVGDAPMEDCGGSDGFRQVMAVLKDKKHQQMGWMHQDRCVERAPGRQIQTLTDTVLLLESSQTTVTVGCTGMRNPCQAKSLVLL